MHYQKKSSIVIDCFYRSPIIILQLVTSSQNTEFCQIQPLVTSTLKGVENEWITFANLCLERSKALIEELALYPGAGLRMLAGSN